MDWIKIIIISILGLIPLFWIELILIVTEQYFLASVLASGMMIGYALLAVVSYKKEIEKTL